MSGGLDARSLQDMRALAEKVAELGPRDCAGCGEYANPEMYGLARDVLVLLDERERLEREYDEATQELAAELAEERVLSRRLKEALNEAILARLAVGERASLDAPEAQQ